MHTTRIRFLTCLSLVVLLASGSLGAGSHTWTNIGPDGGTIVALAIDPQSGGTIYATTTAGMFKSIDGGDHWKPLGMPGDWGGYYSSLAIDPSNPGTVYAGNYRGVFKTTDGGATWQSPSAAFPVTGLAINRRSQGTVFAGSYLGTFKTTDGAATWSAVDFGLEQAVGFPFAIAIDPQNPNTIYAGTGLGLLKSTDGGASWSFITNLAVYLVAIDPRNSNTLYSTNAFTGLYKSTDGGLTWNAAGDGLPQNFAISLSIDPLNEGTVYAATRIGVFKTTNGGRSWGQANTRLTGAFIPTVAIDPQNSANVYVLGGVDPIYGPFNGGMRVFKSTNGGRNWSESNSGLTASSVTAFAIDPEIPNTLYGAIDNALLKTTDGGTTWGRAGGLAGNVSGFAIHPSDSRTVFATASALWADQWIDGGIFKSTDRGATWYLINSGLPAKVYAYSVAIDPRDANTLFAGIVNFGNPGVYKSTDGGTSWSAAGAGLPTNFFAVTSFVFDPQRQATIYAVLYDEWEEDAANVHVGIYKTTDGGASWNAVNDGLPSTPWGFVNVSALALDPRNSDTLYAGTYQGVFKSSNGGASWLASNSGLTEHITSLAIDSLNPNTLYAGTWDRGVFKSTDSGSTWNAVDSGLTPPHVVTVAIDPKDSNRLYAATDGGGVFAITFALDLLVTDLRIDRPSVVAGGSFVVTMSGPQLTTETFFDVRFSTPGSNESSVVMNWQRGISASHDVPTGTTSGIWTITGVRAHEEEVDHTGNFFPVPATITVLP